MIDPNAEFFSSSNDLDLSVEDIAFLNSLRLGFARAFLTPAAKVALKLSVDESIARVVSENVEDQQMVASLRDDFGRIEISADAKAALHASLRESLTQKVCRDAYQKEKDRHRRTNHLFPWRQKRQRQGA